MPKVSRKPLPPIVRAELMSQFWQTLARLKNKSQTQQFFSDLLSSTEELMLAKRLAVAVLLHRGKSQTQIKNALNVSFTNTCSVANWLKNANPETTKLVETISLHHDWQAFIDNIAVLQDKLPLKPGGSWKHRAKAASVAKNQRLTRSTLR